MDAKIATATLFSLFDLLEDMGLSLEESFRMFVNGTAMLALTKSELNKDDYTKEERQQLSSDLYDEIIKTTMRFINRKKEEAING